MSPSITLYHKALKQRFSLNWKLTTMTRLDNQQAPGIHLSQTLNGGLQAYNAMLSILHAC